MPEPAAIGVVIVAFSSEDVLADCLNSLLASDYPHLFIAVCDNASPDASARIVAEVAAAHGLPLHRDRVPATSPGRLPPRLTLLDAGVNRGFAGGVNAGLQFLRSAAGIELFWVLNPDSTVRPDTAGAYAARAAAVGRFGLMSGRTLFHGAAGLIQSDGGRVNSWTGVCKNVNLGQSAAMAAMPAPESLDFLTGANLVASRAFLDRAGLMREDYFLYYEEVDWAQSRGDLPLVLAPDAVVEHHGGTAIGSRNARQAASGFSNYFNYRNRIWFMRRFHPLRLPFSLGYSLARILRMMIQRDLSGARGALAGLLQLPPPRDIRARIGPAAQDRAFGRFRR